MMKALIPNLFYEVVDQHPEKIAIEYGEQRLTYREVDQLSNGIANLLIATGVSRGSYIGIMVDDRSEFVALMLGVLKAGCIFVPLDPAYPATRLELMAEQIPFGAFLADQDSWPWVMEMLAKLGQGAQVILAQGLREKLEADDFDLTRPQVELAEEDPLYVFFSSGSTGKPKGILGKHKGLLHFIRWEIETLQLDERVRASQFASLSFDACLKDIMVPLLAGGTLCIPAQREILLSGVSLKEWINENRLTLVQCVPSIFKLFSSVELTETDFAELKYITMAGEVIRPQGLVSWYEIFGARIQLVNLYGPTETTLTKTFYLIQPADVERRTIPIGKPQKGARVVILDEKMQLCEAGEVGELYIRTPYMTCGYLDAELTKEKFIPNPFTNNPTDLLYRTGDLGRLMFDGNLEFVGRKDYQVKVRGVRIELSDIESQLLRYPKLRDVVVVDREDEQGEKYLAAYYVATGEVSSSQLRSYLLQQLPEFMIPSYFVQLAQMPLSPNGKTDRQALPEPKGEAMRANEYVAPESRTEEVLAQIWSQVLDVEQVGVLDNFFELGGHSLKGGQVVAQIYQELGVELPLRELFRWPQLRELARYIDQSEGKEFLAIPRVPAQEYYPASSAQQRLFVLDQLESATTSYNVPGAVRIGGELNLQQLTGAFNKLVQRHEAFRTSFAIVEGEVVQQIVPELDFQLEVVQGTEAKLAKLAQEFIRPFDLKKAPLFRACLVQVEAEQAVLMYDMHHIVTDGSSQEILVQDLLRLYAGEELPEIKIQYKDFAVWQNQQLGSEGMQAQEEFWLDVFAGELPVLNLPTDYPRSSQLGVKGDHLSFAIGQELTEQLHQLAAQQGATLYMTLLAAYNVLLHKYTGQEDVIVGSPIAGRNYPELEQIMGMFANTLALRNAPAGEKSFAQFLGEVREHALQVYDHQDYPFELLVEKLHLQRDLSRNPLFDTMFVLQNMVRDPEREFPGLTFLPYPLQNPIAKFDLTLGALEVGQRIEFDLEYSTELFTRETMEQLVGHFVRILAVVTEEPELLIREIEIISEAERRMLLTEFNDTEVEFDLSQTMVQIFAEQVAKWPERIAVTFNEQSLSYQELNRRANQLARYLRQQGVQRNSIVGIMVERSLEMLVGVLGIIKAGGAYLPIDPEYPEARIQYLLADSQASLLLTERALGEKLELGGLTEGEPIFLDELSLVGDGTNLQVDIQPDDLIYVIYTSGSTGNPKGVLVQHRQYTNVALGWRQEYHLDQLARPVRLLQMASISFDVFAGDLARALLNGGQMIICPKDLRIDYPALYQLIQKHQITIFESTPALVIPFMDYVDQEQLPLDDLELLILGSDSCRVEDYRKLVARLGRKMRIINSFGATEATIDTSYYEATVEEIPLTGNLPIGKPLPNMKMYVLDDHLQLKPVGVIGELYIGGTSVAQGYWRRPELTAERFIPNPYFPGERLYKTGDLARWRRDGNLEFLGRLDHQVKIRGYRVEPGEIENQLLTYPPLKEVAVIDWTDPMGEKDLVAYLVAEEPVLVNELREYLGQRLPEYLIPAYFMQLEQLPLTPNGKIDRRALPEPDGRMATGVEYLAPRTATEAALVQIWEATLHRDQIGVNDQFFELGGHSLKATTMVARVYQELQVQLPLREVFKTPTIAELALKIDRLQQGHYQGIQPVAKKEVYPVSSAQKRLFILNQLDQTTRSYNISWVLELVGEVDLQRFAKAFDQLIARQDSLRTSFELLDGEPVQRIHDYEQVNFQINYREVGEEELAVEIDELIQPFDLSQAPLMRTSVLETEERRLLVIDLHHIIADGVSMDLLIADFGTLYAGEELPPLAIQYKDFAVWQSQFQQSRELAKQEEFWLASFQGDLPVLNLPTDYPRSQVMNFAGARYPFDLDAELTEQLNQLASQQGATLYMVLLAGFNLLLSKYTEQDDLIVGTPVAGRTHPELEQIVGMFVNTLAMRNRPQKGLSVIEFLAAVKDQTIQAFEHQDYQFEMLVEQLHLPTNLSRNPLFDVMFVLQNTEEPEMSELDLTFAPVDFALDVAKFDLTWNAQETAAGLRCYFEYKTQIFNPTTIQRMAGHLIQILRQVVAEPSCTIAELELVTPEEREQILTQFNQPQLRPTDLHLPSPNIYQLFAEQVAKEPERVAVVLGTEHLTYRELDQRSTALAGYLCQRGVGADKIVGIMVERSLALPIGILAILKAGGAYLPIDPAYPAERIRYQLADSQLELLLTQKHLLEVLAGGEHDENGPDQAGRVIWPDLGVELVDVEDESLYLSSSAPVDRDIQPTQLAYVIYTSGSTGQPKGVMIEHRNVANTLVWRKREYQLTDQDRALQLFSVAFDGFVTSFFTPLLSGTPVVMVTDEQGKDPLLIKEEIKAHQITHLLCVPTLYSAILAVAEPGELASLRVVTLAGEQVPLKLVAASHSQYPEVELVNEYGPTENSVASTCARQLAGTEQVTIGKPIENTRVYLVNQENQLRPIGLPGEICLGGRGLARGYLHRPELTAAKFVPDPFSPEEKMYRTGDQARWLPDGRLEFLGRIDDQVKIRGYRIEPGEIEEQLLSHPLVQEGVVLAREDAEGQAELGAYFTTSGEVANSDLREYLLQRLPDYMVPTDLVQLESLPLTPGGKVDRQALLTVEGQRETGREYVAPTNLTEERLRIMWMEILGRPNVSIEDNFFALGGHSLKATTLVARIYQELAVQLTLSQIFQTSTIKEQARLIHQAKSRGYLPIEAVTEQNRYPVSSAQRRLFAIQQLNEASTIYNIPLAMRIEGGVDQPRLTLALEKLIQRHQALRTSFQLDGKELIQQVHDEVEVAVTRVKASKESLTEVTAELIRPFDLGQAPLFRVWLVECTQPGPTAPMPEKEEQEQLLIFDIHHIISDGRTMEILLTEFLQLYAGHNLPPLRIQYTDYAVWEQRQLARNAFQKQAAYWLDQFSQGVPLLKLATDYPRIPEQMDQGDTYQLTIDPQLTEGIRELAAATGATLYMTLLAAINTLLYKYTGQEEIIIGAPIAGRNHPDLEQVVGMFVNNLPLRNQPTASKTFSTLLTEVKANALQAYENQDYQYDQLVERLGLERELGRNPIFDVVFVMQNPDATIQLAEADLKLTPYPLRNETAKFDLTFNGMERADQIELRIEYRTGLFKPETIADLAQHLVNLLHEVTKNPDLQLAEIRMFSEVEQAQFSVASSTEKIDELDTDFNF